MPCFLGQSCTDILVCLELNSQRLSLSITTKQLCVLGSTLILYKSPISHLQKKDESPLLHSYCKV